MLKTNVRMIKIIFKMLLLLIDIIAVISWFSLLVLTIYQYVSEHLQPTNFVLMLLILMPIMFDRKTDFYKNTNATEV